MLNGGEVGSGFIDSTFTPDNGPTNCGDDSVNTRVQPLRDVGSASSNGVAWFREEARAYGSSTDAQKVLDLVKDQATCPSPTIAGGESLVITATNDVTAQMTTAVEEAIEIEFETTEATGQFFVIKDTVAVLTFEVATQKGTDPGRLPDALSVVNKGLKKIVS